MKHVLFSAALLLAAAGTASAMVTPGALSAADLAYAQRLVPNGDFANLTTEQALAIASILHSGNDNRGGQIRAILN